MILVNESLDFKLENIKKDQQGRLIILQCCIQGSPFQITNLYAPNTNAARLNFFKHQVFASVERSNRADISLSSKNIIGGDYNTIINTKLDRKGGTGNLRQTT
jgi:exonuclease III